MSHLDDREFEDAMMEVKKANTPESLVPILKYLHDAGCSVPGARSDLSYIFIEVSNLPAVTTLYASISLGDEKATVSVCYKPGGLNRETPEFVVGRKLLRALDAALDAKMAQIVAAKEKVEVALQTSAEKVEEDILVALRGRG